MLIVNQRARTRVERSIKVWDKREARYWVNAVKGSILRKASIDRVRATLHVQTFLIFDRRFLMWQGQVEVWTTVVRLEGEAS